MWLSRNSVFVGISAATTQLTVVCSSTAIGNGCNTGSACITYPTAQKPNNRTTTDLRELRSRKADVLKWFAQPRWRRPLSAQRPLGVFMEPWLADFLLFRAIAKRESMTLCTSSKCAAR